MTTIDRLRHDRRRSATLIDPEGSTVDPRTTVSGRAMRWLEQLELAAAGVEKIDAVSAIVHARSDEHRGGQESNSLGEQCIVCSQQVIHAETEVCVARGVRHQVCPGILWCVLEQFDDVAGVSQLR